MPYQPNIPTGTVPLNQDYLNLLGNFQSLDTSFGVDHLPFSNLSAQNGYHTSIHFVPVSTGSPNIPPTGYTNTTGFGQLFTATTNDGVATDQMLFYDSGTGNNLIQLTNNFTPTNGIYGKTFLPGGIIEQWGQATVVSTSAAVLFATNNINFPNDVYNIQLTNLIDSSATAKSSAVTVKSGSVSRLGFTITAATSSFPQVIYWRAIGG